MPMRSSPEDPVPVRTVSRAVADWIGRLGRIWGEGQLTQISRRPGAGMVFLTLRDPSADVSLSVTAPRRRYDAIDPPLAEGARVVVLAKPNFYQPRGTFSLTADEIRPVGVGELLARLEQLKRRLAAEGLFAPERKLRLPFLPRRIGLVCGRASAAERDVLENARRRWPAVSFRVVPCAVQGAYAVAQVTAAIAELDADPEIDVIVVARGGGSVEDLLPFSDEELIRAVAACRTPVVSAIGHEPDTPLLDLVADLRASTPTDAAKKIVPDVGEEIDRIARLREQATSSVRRLLDREERGLANARNRPALAAPYALVDGQAEQLEALRQRAVRSVAHRLARADDDLGHLLHRVRALSPLATLKRGYAIVRRDDGQVVRTTTGVEPGEDLEVRLADGQLAITVRSVPPAEEQPGERTGEPSAARSG
jgi:exodeoxyribonuclease VII large subunit